MQLQKFLSRPVFHAWNLSVPTVKIPECSLSEKVKVSIFIKIQILLKRAHTMLLSVFVPVKDRIENVLLRTEKRS